MHTSPESPSPQRFVSVDVLRGFDMFWITGGEAFVVALAGLCGPGLREPVARQMHHVAWEGFHFMDLIFPLFVFLAGMSTVFSLSRRLEQRGLGAALWRLTRRSVLLYLLGLFYYHGVAGGFGQIRYVGVLQRIAISSFCAGLCFLFLKRRGLWVVLGAVLVGYYLLIAFVPAPGQTAPTFAQEGHWALWIDQHFLGGRRWNGNWDPEGLLSGIPAVGTALLGVFAGLLMRDPDLSGTQRLRHLLAWGLGCLLLGWVWSLHFPLVKVVWSSSYVLVAGGWSFLLLALCYGLVDLLGWQRPVAPFRWIGMNAITLYLAHNLVSFGDLANRLVGGEIPHLLGEPWYPLLHATVALGLSLVLARFLYRRRIFLRL